VGFKPDLSRPTGFLQCFNTVGLVIWPVKIVLEMTYYVSSGTLNPTHSHSLLTISVTIQNQAFLVVECQCFVSKLTVMCSVVQYVFSTNVYFCILVCINKRVFGSSLRVNRA